MCLVGRSRSTGQNGQRVTVCGYVAQDEDDLGTQYGANGRRAVGVAHDTDFSESNQTRWQRSENPSGRRAASRNQLCGAADAGAE